MRMQLGVVTAAWLMSAAAVLADPFQTKGQIDAVTVYRGQALVTRLVDVPAGGEDAATGLRELVVTDLPLRVVPGSLHAESGSGVQVRSVRFRTRPVAVENREEVRKIDERIEQIADRLAANKRNAEVLTEQRAYLKSLEAFVAPTATVEMTKGVLNAETLEKTSAFLMKNREQLATRDLELGREQKKLNSEMELAQRERQQLTVGSSRTVNEAVVYVSRDDAGKGAGGAAGKLRLRYLVEDATWTPSYNARAPLGEERSGIVLEYYAAIQQMSGEDWSNVTMTLSTATPSLVSRAPTLSALKVGFIAPEAAQAQAPRVYAQERSELAKKQLEAEKQWLNRAPAPGQNKDVLAVQFDDKSNILSLNTLACDLQVLDLVAGERVHRDAGRPRVSLDENLSVTYAIAGRSSLPSRNDRQLIQIASLPMKAAFTKVGVPVLTGQVYDEATATNEGQMVLLAGPVTAYSDGSFVGSGELPTTAAGQSFTVGFGIDSSLRTGRELVDRTETTQGGNRVVELTYRLTVENFGSKAARVRLMDRLPKAESSDIRVTMVSSSPETSSAEEFAKEGRKDGILKWDVEVPAQAMGAKAFAVEYKFRLEYDKQRMLAGLGER